MQAMLSALIQRPRTILMIMVLLTVAGVTTYITIAKESSPNIAMPMVNVSISFEGVSAEDAESLLVKPLEQELRDLEGLKSLIAQASEGHAGLTLEFYNGINETTMMADVRAKVDNARALFPKGADEPSIEHLTAANQEVIVTLLVSGSQSYRSLLNQAKQLQKQIELMPQILKVSLVGDSDEVIDIEIDPRKLLSYQLDVGSITQLLAANSALVAAGSLESELGNLALKIPSVFREPEDVLSQPVVADGHKVLLLRDIADIRFTYKTPQELTRLNGEPSIELRIYKKSGESIIDLVNDLKVLTAGLQQTWPVTTKVTYLHDKAEDVKDMIGDLQSSILSSVALVVIVLVAALGMRSALLVGLSIPISFLSGVLFISALGYSVNMVVLFSLIMAVGMLVDGAIVVVELAQRKLQQGLSSHRAYIEAAQSMAWPITASTATTLSAFIPLLFWPGFFGQFMKYLPITLIATLTASLLVALVIIPTLGRVLDAKRYPQLSGSPTQPPLVDLSQLKGAAKTYVGLLDKVISHPLKVLSVAVLVLASIFYAYGESGLGVEFFPDEDNRVIQVLIKDDGAPYSLHEKQQIVDRVYQRLLQLPYVQDIQLQAAGRDQVGAFAVTLLEWQERPPAAELVSKTRQLLKDFAWKIEVLNEAGPQSGKPFQLQISGHGIAKLREFNQQVQALMRVDGRFVNIEDNTSSGGVEWQLAYDKNLAAQHQVGLNDIGSAIKLLTNGVYVAAYRPDYAEEDIDIRLRLPKAYRHLSQLDHLMVNSAQGLVPISPFLQPSIQARNNIITRVDGEQAITINADLADGAQLSQVLTEFEPQLSTLDIKYEFKGEAKDQAESGTFLVKAFIVAVFLMMIILVTQFNSYFQVGLILSAVIFSSGGVLIGLMLQQMAFSIVMSGIGVIALAGIVVNNNIVLIDTFNGLIKQGLDTRQAVLMAVYLRLRPVMLTTVTTILGLLPLAIGWNIDLLAGVIEIDGPSASVWGLLASAIVSGLSFASIITLLLTPCLLMLRANKPNPALAAQLQS